MNKLDPNQPLKWGIFSGGKISSDFVTALRVLSKSEHEVTGIATRDENSAKEFAQRFQIPKWFSSYEQLAADPEVDIIYIGSVNTQHFPLGKLAISHGKHVLIEKPLCVTLKETQELIEYSREKNVFLMEAIWSRFFPAYDRIREEIKSGSLGEILQVIAYFCSAISHKERIKMKELGGGTILDIGVYAIQFVTMVFNERPEKILTGGVLSPEGVDESSSSTLLYSGGKTATIITHGKVKMESEAWIIGTKGTIKVPFRFWCPHELITPNGTETFQLPQLPEGATMNYANSVGLSYQAQEIRKCLLEGKCESPLMKKEDSLILGEIMESMRKQIGVVYPQDLQS